MTKRKSKKKITVDLDFNDKELFKKQLARVVYHMYMLRDGLTIVIRLTY